MLEYPVTKKWNTLSRMKLARPMPFGSTDAVARIIVLLAVSTVWVACSSSSTTTIEPAGTSSVATQAPQATQAPPGNGSSPTPTQAAPTEPPQTTDEIAVDTGHADSFHIAFDEGALSMHFAYDGPCAAPFTDTEYYAPESVVMYVKPEAEIEVPPGFDFLGAAGSQVWLLPQAQECDLLWPGLSTESTSLDGWNNFEFNLQSVEGPGNFVLFTTGSFGSATVFWNWAEGALSFTAPVGTHAHYNWAFTEPGAYTIVVEASGSHPTLGQHSTGPAAFRIVVGESAAAVIPRTGQ